MPVLSRLLLLLIWTQAVSAQVSRAVLTNAVDVLALPADQALSGMEVSIQGVVTAAQPDWQGRFFVQDDTAGIFVENISDRHPAPGDVVRVTGVTHPGGFAPIITRPRWEKVGTAPLPPAKAVSIEALMLGAEDSQRVETSGTVRTARAEPNALVFHIRLGGYQLQVMTPAGAVPEPEQLVGAKVRVRGTAAAAFNAPLRQLITMNLFVPAAQDFIVEKMETGDPFNKNAIPIAELAQYRFGESPGERVHIRGTVMYQRPGEDLFIHDGTGGLRVRTDDRIRVERGAVVSAIGFADFEDFLPTLQNAVIRRIEGQGTPITPTRVTLRELESELHHGDLIVLQGKVLDRMVRHINPGSKDMSPEQVILTVQSANFLFTVEGPATESNAELAELPVGSTVEVTGIGMLRIAANGVLESVQVLLPAAGNLRIVQRPSWLTPRRLLIGLGGVSAVLILAVSWTVTLSRKNTALKGLIREKVKAQEELQQAHDFLEERVRERTAQLKFEMTARKEAEVQSRATLAERTRLAQELHDTLEQSLAGIHLQLDTASKLFDTRTDGARRHLELARSLMTHSQTELRRSIWDLRSRELDQFDLPAVLQANAREILQGTDIKLAFQVTGHAESLSEVVEENVLRIAREALTNIIKHARAERVEISLAFDSLNVVLGVKDDGRGFSPDACPGAAEGHFGLLGMSERAKRLNGRFRVDSTPGGGTCVTVEIPMRIRDSSHPAATAETHEI